MGQNNGRNKGSTVSTEEFLGRTLMTCRSAGGCVSVFQGSSLTLGQMADACVYVGGGADVDSKAKPTRFYSATSRLNRPIRGGGGEQGGGGARIKRNLARGGRAGWISILV